MVEATCKGATQDRDVDKQSLLKAKRTAVVRPNKNTCNLSFLKVWEGDPSQQSGRRGLPPRTLRDLCARCK